MEALVINIVISGILEDTRYLLENIKEMGKKCKSYKVKYVFISSLTFGNRISHMLLKEVNQMKERVCLGNSYPYIENRNVQENDLFKDGLRLQGSAKKPGLFKPDFWKLW